MKRKSCLMSSSISDSLSPSVSKRAKEGKANISSGLEHLWSLFPTQVFLLPPIALRHQLYSLHTDRTAVDRQVEALRESGVVRLLKLGASEEDYCLIRSQQYCDYLQSCLGEGGLGTKVTESLLKNCHDVSVTNERLTELKFSNEDISGLVSRGVLLVRDVDTGRSWWCGVPGVSPFIRSLTRGRSMLQQIIGRSRFKEMLRRDVLSKRMTVSKLPIEYHIHDLVGGDLLERVETTSGDLLRLTDATH